MDVDVGGDAFAGVLESALDDLHRTPALRALGSFEFAVEAFGMEVVVVGCGRRALTAGTVARFLPATSKASR